MQGSIRGAPCSPTDSFDQVEVPVISFSQFDPVFADNHFAEFGFGDFEW
jgi:hypothetical protein